MVHLRVELNAPGLLAGNLESGVLHALGRTYDAGVLRKADDGVAVRHPYGGFSRQALHKRVGSILDAQACPSVFAGACRSHFAAAVLGKPLGTVAYSKQREHSPNACEIRLRRVRIADG